MGSKDLQYRWSGKLEAWDVRTPHPPRLTPHGLLLLFIPFVVVFATAGCGTEDTDRLGKIGRLVAARAESLASGTNGKLSSDWKAACGISAGNELAQRVGARLRWDKDFADTEIEVTADGATVELIGKITSKDQRHHAVDIAQSTAGVEKVVDSLEGPAPE